MLNEYRLTQAAMGSFVGLLIGSAIQLAFGLSEDPFGHRRLPTEGFLLGIIIGIPMGILAAKVKICGMFGQTVVGALTGLTVGVVLGWFGGTLFPAEDDKTHAVHTIMGVFGGGWIGTAIGSGVGLLRAWAKERSDAQLAARKSASSSLTGE